MGPEYECEENKNQIYNVKYKEGKVTFTSTDIESQSVEIFEGNVSLMVVVTV
ncbi:hypothetical protein K9O30_06885 [Clostridium bowmanii]|uniref:hypothetical protein n=1 Tax=Clostridium bowmanii TaxID=132925 RepID=UPI001C0E68F6|nr:hypothetical protein [Clostridium bowmanii]MBU3191347.1 hypothetical protein [Clostridium bowmanii]MCA1073460.1 hypothetical protein [Clostridium bowmanii]